MGIKRDIARIVFGVVLLLGGWHAAAAEPPQPGWTSLPDPNAGFVRLPDPQQQVTQPLGDGDPALDEAIERFGTAVAQAIRLDQRAIDAACKSIKAVHGRSARISAWQADCRYRRY
jgi:hypothetical protein